MSSEEMQIRFAKILSGEIKNPSSFSIRSIKILSEIDTHTANLFARIGGQLGSNCMKNYGMSYDNLTRLMEFDLISSDLNSYMPYSGSILPYNSSTISMPFYYQNKPYLLKQQEENLKQIPDFKIHGVALTKAGVELYSVVDMISHESHFKDLQDHFLSQKLIIQPLGVA